MSIGYLPQEGLRLTGRTDLRRMPHGLRRAARDGARSRTPERRSSPSWTTPAPNTSRPPSGFHCCRSAFTRSMATRSMRRWAPCLPASASARKTGRGRPTNSPAAGRCALRWPSCCWPSRTCCCSTSRPIISISKRATGSRTTSQTYPFGYILISHDRYFLDVTIDRTVEIWNKRLTIYQGNYHEIPHAER